MMHIRLVVGGLSEDHRTLSGLVVEARVLRDAGALTMHEEAVLQGTTIDLIRICVVRHMALRTGPTQWLCHFRVNSLHQ